MPSLLPADRKALLGPVGRCSCGTVMIRHYCRSCDEFFVTCACCRGETHEGHRIYKWTTGGILAIPNFDGVRL